MIDFEATTRQQQTEHFIALAKEWYRKEIFQPDLASDFGVTRATAYGWTDPDSRIPRAVIIALDARLAMRRAIEDFNRILGAHAPSGGD